MRALAFLILFIPYQSFAKAPECPAHATRQECLSSVEKDFQNLLDFIKDDYEPKEQEPLILAAQDIHHYESLACQKTCLN